MSWSISKTLSGNAPLRLQAIDPATVGNDDAPEERNEQIAAAVEAASKLLTEGGFDNAEEITLSMSGHANKNHDKDNSVSNEFITINVYVKSYKSES